MKNEFIFDSVSIELDGRCNTPSPQQQNSNHMKKEIGFHSHSFFDGFALFFFAADEKVKGNQ